MSLDFKNTRPYHVETTFPVKSSKFGNIDPGNCFEIAGPASLGVQVF